MKKLNNNGQLNLPINLNNMSTIKDFYRKTIYSDDNLSIKECIKHCIDNNIDLSRADLSDSDLSDIDLSGVVYHMLI